MNGFYDELLWWSWVGKWAYRESVEFPNKPVVVANHFDVTLTINSERIWGWMKQEKLLSYFRRRRDLSSSNKHNVYPGL